MHQESVVKSDFGRLIRVPRVRFGAVLASALAAGFAAWLIVGTGRHSSTLPAASSNGNQRVASTGPEAMSSARLKSFAAAVGHAVYWAGPMPGATYELTQTSSGRIYIRYLPAGVKVGVNKPFLTIATYPYPHAFAALKALVKNGSGAITLAQGGIALVDKAYPKSVHMAFPGSDYQVEVFDPSPPRALEVAVSGEVAPVR